MGLAQPTYGLERAIRLWSIFPAENFANMTLSTAGFKLLAPPSWQLNGWHWNLPPIVNLASRALNGV